MSTVHGASVMVAGTAPVNTAPTSDLMFDSAFQALTDHAPFRWQQRLYERFRSGQNLPHRCDLPTGLGKTSVIPIWLIAVAQQASEGAVRLPRRLVYIVDRRTVVDQATSVVERIRERLLMPDGEEWSNHAAFLRTLAAALRRMTSTLDMPLAVSTLRGKLADNQEWKADPSRATIIVGTIDMIGSKLLFSGYGDSRYTRPQHAAFIGQDTLIIHDEAHLSPAFGHLLRRIAAVQRQPRELRPLHVVELSATPPTRDGDASESGAGDFKLEPGDEQDAAVEERMGAAKQLRLHPPESADCTKKLVELAKQHDGERTKVLVYVRSPEDATKVANQLEKAPSRVDRECIAQLTGTLRGHERDELVDTPVFQAFLDPNCKVEQTVYLVSTSAGEVGIDLDADHLVCDLTTLDGMMQRLGRVNRRGGSHRVARVDVVLPPEPQGALPEALRRAIWKTGDILQQELTAAGDLLDVCPRSLSRLLGRLPDEERRAAFAPQPTIVEATDVVLDAWSLTSITKPMPGRPDVAPYLHGRSDDDPPETDVAWRKEVDRLHGSNASAEMLGDWFAAFPIETHERLHDRTDRIKRTFARLHERHCKEKGADCDFPVVVLNDRGEAEWSRLSVIAARDFPLGYSTVVLPVDAGGLDSRHGSLDETVLVTVRDVAEAPSGDDAGRRRERWLQIENEEGPIYERLLTGETFSALPDGPPVLEQIALEQPPEDSEGEGEGERRCLLALVNPKDAALTRPDKVRVQQTLEDHTRQIVRWATCIAQAVDLSESCRPTLIAAAERHDLGKSRERWQRYACNFRPGQPSTALAKSKKYLHPRALGGYRHEFGSVLDAVVDRDGLSEVEQDLMQHLIAAHHGCARPHFERKAGDPDRTTATNEDAAIEVARRFGRLQQHYGRWGLAWLESLLRCADIAASTPGDDSESPHNQPEEQTE